MPWVPDPRTGEPVWVEEQIGVSPPQGTFQDSSGKTYPKRPVNPPGTTLSKPEDQVIADVIKSTQGVVGGAANPAAVDQGRGTYVDASGRVQPKIGVNPPAYNPQPDYTANFNDWKLKQDNQDIYTTEALKGAQLERQAAYTDWASNTKPMVDQLGVISGNQAAARESNTAGLRSAYEGLNQQDAAALAQFQQRNNDLYNKTVQPYQAAQWQSNPQDIQRQTQSYDQLYGIGQGSLDYTAAQAQAAQAQAKMAKLYQYASDPTDVNRQKAAIQELHGMIDGGEWNSNLREVRDKYKSLSDPEITAQERFIMEQFRQQREQAEGARRGAVMSNLEARGLRSGAAEQAGMLTAQQELGRENVLANLGAEANAINRAQNSMAGWANTTAQGQNHQLAAMGMYVDAAGNLRAQNDQVGMFNTSEANSTERLNATNQTNVNMHNATLQTQTNQFNAGQTNQARANNQATRLSGATNAATQSNAIRQANDYVGTFNTGQTNLVGMQNQRVAQDELVRQGSVAQAGLAGTTLTNAGIAGRQGVIHDNQQADIDSRALGETGAVGAQIGWQGTNATNRIGIANTGADTAITNAGVFTPTRTATAEGQNRIIQGRAATDPTKRLG